MQRISINTFTNPNGEHVAQGFVNGLCLTREFPIAELARVENAARTAFIDAPGHATLSLWNSHSGDTMELARK